MIERIIRGSFHHAALTLLLVVFGVVGGVASWTRLPSDVFPDLSTPVFSVIIQNKVMAPEELETAIAIPLESALSGLAGVRRVRSSCQLGVATIVVEFDPDNDYFRSRQLVAERLATAVVNLPPGTESPLLSSLTGRLNEIMELTLEAEAESADLMTLREVAEFDLKNRLAAIPGVAAVETLGGYLREFQVQLDPARMQARHVTLDQVLHAVEDSNHNASGGFLVRGSTEWTFRALGRLTSVEDLRRTVVNFEQGIAVTIDDIADVREAGAVRRGMAHRIKGEVISLRISKQFGSDTVEVSKSLNHAVTELRRTLPPGLQLFIVYDQAQLVTSSLTTVFRSIVGGGVLVIAVLLLLLGDLRAALLVILTLPLSIALSGTILRQLNIGINTMTLGGLAIAVGLLVDAAIILTENIVHRLSRFQYLDSESRKHQALQASLEVAHPIAFATLIVASVFLPLYAMTGIEGRMYRPLAVAVASAMLAALTLSLTAVPIVGARWLRGKASGQPEDPRLIRMVKRRYAPLLDRSLAHPGYAGVFSLLALAGAVGLAMQIGSEFMPEIDEGALLLQTNMPSEASLDQVDRLNHRVEDALREFPEVVDVVRRTGRAERTEDPMPHTLSDVLVLLKPDRARRGEELVQALREKVGKIPGISALFTTPLGMRIDEGLGGTPADISVRIFGPDLAVLGTLGEQAKELIESVGGLEDLRVEQLTGYPQLQVRVDREACARHGVHVGELARAISVGFAGLQVGEVVIGQRRYDLTVVLGESFRRDLDAIRSLQIDTEDGRRVPLISLATVEESVGPGSIRREAGSRRIALEASVEGRDLVSVASEIRTRLERELKLPTGYFIDLSGRVEQQKQASAALLQASLAGIALVVILLYLALGRWSETLLVLLTLPIALTGGVLFLWLFDGSWNVSSLVGLIGLFGIAVQNSLVLISQVKQQIKEGHPFDQAIREASIGRVRPKLMTASTAILGLLPLILSSGQGSEIERPLAIVMVGGLITSTLFTLLVLPSFLSRWYRSSRPA